MGVHTSDVPDDALFAWSVLTLSTDVTYDFSGSWVATALTLDHASRCRDVLCEEQRPIESQPVSYSGPGHWEVQPVAVEDGLIIVDIVAVVNYMATCSDPGATCYDAWYTLGISPCPPLESCGQGDFEWSLLDGADDLQPPDPFRIALSPGVEYHLTGGANINVRDLQQGGGCDYSTSACRLLETFADTVYVSGPVATPPTSWGSLKSRF